MTSDDVQAEYREESNELVLGFGRNRVVLDADRFVDAVHVVKGDIMQLRTTAMTRYAFEGWKKALNEEPYASVARFIERCEQQRASG